MNTNPFLHSGHKMTGKCSVRLAALTDQGVRDFIQNFKNAHLSPSSAKNVYIAFTQITARYEYESLVCW